MFLSQVRLTTGMHLLGLADLSPERARERMLEVGWPKQQTEAKSMADALATGKTFLTDEAMGVISHPEVEVVIEATGDPATGIRPRAAIGWTGISSLLALSAGAGVQAAGRRRHAGEEGRHRSRLFHR